MTITAEKLRTFGLQDVEYRDEDLHQHTVRAYHLPEGRLSDYLEHHVTFEQELNENELEVTARIVREILEGADVFTYRWYRDGVLQVLVVDGDGFDFTTDAPGVETLRTWHPDDDALIGRAQRVLRQALAA